MDRQYIETVVEIAIHNRWAAAWLYGKMPVSMSSDCPCKFCKERKKP